MYCVILLNFRFRVQQPKNSYQFKMKLAVSKKMRRYTLSIYLINTLREKKLDTNHERKKEKKGSMVGWWLSQSEGLRFESWLSSPVWSSVWSLHVLMSVWVFSGYFSILPQFKNMHGVRLIDSKLAVGMSMRLNCYQFPCHAQIHTCNQFWLTC